MDFYRDLWIIFQLFFLVGHNRCQTIQDRIDDLTKQFEAAFNNLRKVLRPMDLVANISNVYANQVDEVAATNILTASKVDTEKLIINTNNAVDRIQSFLTTTYREYTPKPSEYYAINCNSSTFINYYRAKAIKNNTIPMESSCKIQELPFMNDSFLDNVWTNRNISTAHVPTTVFDSSIAIQIVANWTNNLDKIFVLRQKDPQLKWQYFCSNLGLFKIYPGIRWGIQKIVSGVDNAPIDQFDCRSEEFYLMSTAYPKRMLIMVDRSGSMFGMSMPIAQEIVLQILLTLTENDFFNVLLFSENCTFTDNTTKSILIQATRDNIMVIYSQLRKLYKPENRANFKACATIAFNLLRDDKKNQTGNIPYNYFVSIITDGSFQYSADSIHNDIGARIFTYITVEGAPERSTVESIACSNKGFATQTKSRSMVKENVQEYLSVVARPNAIMSNSFNVWTGVRSMQMNPSVDPVPPTVQLSLTTTPVPGLVTISYLPNVTSAPPLNNDNKISIIQDKPINLFVATSKAVYDQKESTLNKGNGILLGAAGIDISTNEFIKTAPFWKIGVNAYLFGITSRGFVVFHPKFRPQYKKEIKEFYKSVDINEVEVETTTNISSISSDLIIPSKNTLRNAMLNLSPENPVKRSSNFITYQIVDDYKTGFPVSRNYFIAGIKLTSYKFGLAIPENQIVPIYSKDNFTAVNKITWKNDMKIDYDIIKNQCNIKFFKKGEGGMALKNFEFCYMNQYLVSLQLKDPMCILLEVLANSTYLGQCVTNTPDSLIYLNNIYIEMKYTSGFPIFWSSIQDVDRSSVQQVFSMHHFGLTRYYNYENLFYQDFISNHSLGVDDPLYQETILAAKHFNNTGILVARPLPNIVLYASNSEGFLTFMITTALYSNGTYLGIVGVQARHSVFQSILSNHPLCNNNNEAQCFVITESAIILLNNQDFTQTGKLLKDENCALMESLVNNNVFVEQYFYDFQGLCDLLQGSLSSFSPKLVNPVTYLLQLFIHFIFQSIIIIQRFSFTNLMWPFSNQEENPQYNVTSGRDGMSCFLKIPTTMIKPLSTQINGNFTCPNCQINWFIRPITDTNLFLIVMTRSPKDCSCSCQGPFGTTSQLTRNPNNSITNSFSVNPNFYSSFVPFTKTENSTICSKTNIIPSVKTPLLLGISLLLMIYFK